MCICTCCPQIYIGDQMILSYIQMGERKKTHSRHFWCWHWHNIDGLRRERFHLVVVAAAACCCCLVSAHWPRIYDFHARDPVECMCTCSNASFDLQITINKYDFMGSEIRNLYVNYVKIWILPDFCAVFFSFPRVIYLRTFQQYDFFGVCGAVRHCHLMWCCCFVILLFNFIHHRPSFDY